MHRVGDDRCTPAEQRQQQSMADDADGRAHQQEQWDVTTDPLRARDAWQRSLLRSRGKLTAARASRRATPARLNMIRRVFTYPSGTSSNLRRSRGDRALATHWRSARFSHMTFGGREPGLRLSRPDRSTAARGAACPLARARSRCARPRPRVRRVARLPACAVRGLRFAACAFPAARLRGLRPFAACALRRSRSARAPSPPARSGVPFAAFPSRRRRCLRLPFRRPSGRSPAQAAPFEAFPFAALPFEAFRSRAYPFAGDSFAGALPGRLLGLARWRLAVRLVAVRSSRPARPSPDDVPSAGRSGPAGPPAGWTRGIGPGQTGTRHRRSSLPGATAPVPDDRRTADHDGREHRGGLAGMRADQPAHDRREPSRLPDAAPPAAPDAATPRAAARRRRTSSSPPRRRPQRREQSADAAVDVRRAPPPAPGSGRSRPGAPARGRRRRPRACRASSRRDGGPWAGSPHRGRRRGGPAGRPDADPPGPGRPTPPPRWEAGPSARRCRRCSAAPLPRARARSATAAAAPRTPGPRASSPTRPRPDRTTATPLSYRAMSSLSSSRRLPARPLVETVAHGRQQVGPEGAVGTVAGPQGREDLGERVGDQVLGVRGRRSELAGVRPRRREMPLVQRPVGRPVTRSDSDDQLGIGGRDRPVGTGRSGRAGSWSSDRPVGPVGVRAEHLYLSPDRRTLEPRQDRPTAAMAIDPIGRSA